MKYLALLIIAFIPSQVGYDFDRFIRLIESQPVPTVGSFGIPSGDYLDEVGPMCEALLRGEKPNGND